MKSALLVALAVGIAGIGIAADTPQGYLAPHGIDITTILPPAPTKGDIRYETDRSIFRAMKAKIGSPRWAAAKADVDYATPTMMHDFECAAGVTLDSATLPATTRLLANASADTGRANNDAKEFWKRLRPFRIDEGETCQAKKELGDSFDYPSGHTTKGWTLGLVLADLLPDRAGPIMARAREYGESRIVCRVHNMSAVEAGRISATVSMEQVRAAPGYGADVAAAKAELATAHPAAPDAGRCTAEKAVLEPSVLAGLKE
jgi:acid phosphatase (class A)